MSVDFSKIPITFNYSAHKRLWLWLAENPKEHEYDWPEWETLSEPQPAYHCFACQYAKSVVTLIGAIGAYNCTYCPFGNYGKMHDACLDGLYVLWSIVRKGYLDSCHRRLRDQTSEYAKRIVLLTPREGVKCV